MHYVSTNFLPIAGVYHFYAIDYIIDNTDSKLSEAFIKHLHFLLKAGTSDARKSWFKVGDYKCLPNEVGGGGNDTVEPENVHKEIKALLIEYNGKKIPLSVGYF